MSDLLVVGGGPAGLATALHGRRDGLQVTVWEHRRGTIDKACGEGLMPAAVEALADLGVTPPGEPLIGITYLDQARSTSALFRSGPGRGVRRTTLHDALRSAALDAGVRFVRRRMSTITQDASGTRVDGSGFGYVVAADGLHSPTRRMLGLQGRPSRLRRYGQRVHVETAPWTSYVEVHWSAHAEAYVTPVAADLVGVAILTSRRAHFAELLHGFPALERRLDGLAMTSAQGAGPLSQRTRRRVEGRVLLVGDASGYVDALTGEGISLALAQARAAVQAVVAGDPQRYEKDWWSITRDYRLLTNGLLAVTTLPPLRRALVPAASVLPGVFAAAVNTLASPPTLVRSAR